MEKRMAIVNVIPVILKSCLFKINKNFTYS